MDVVEESKEVNVPLIHQIDGTHLDIHLIHCIDVMYRCLCKMYEDREITSQVNLCMYFYATLIFTELGPWTEFEAQTDGGAVESINHIVNIKSELVLSIQRPHFLYQDFSQLGIDVPVPVLVGFGQRISGNCIADTAVIQLLYHGQCIQACFDITQAVLVGILSHAHYKKLIMTGKIPDSVITLVPGNYFVEFSTRNKLHNLSENCFAGIHFVRYLKGNVKVTNSNRVQEIQSIYC